MESHAVQLYEREDFLHAAVARFVDAGLRAGEPLVVLATGRSRDALHERLAWNGLDAGAAQRSGRLVLLDAEETLGRLMVGSAPDRERFDAVVGDVIRRTASLGGPRVRAYGEMVDLLFRDGRPQAALHLEALWNDLATRHRFRLLCACGLAHFRREDQARELRAACDVHTHVLPAETWREDAGEEERRREVAMLQQRARALEHELERRAALEEALRAALRDVQRSEEALQAADRRKDEFLAMLGHELRNPLSPILTALQVLRLRRVDGGKERDVIERQVKHLARLVDDLLDVSRISRGKIRLERERVEISAVLAKAVEMARPLLDQRAHALEVDVPAERLAVEGDPVRLAQVFGNVLSNAAKYTDPGGRVALSARREDAEVVVRVRDSGIGIAAEMLPRVFDLFVQGERSLDRSQGGLGIGLTLARNLVELHGGTIGADSAGAGAGSEFVVRLPLALEPRATAGAHAGAKARAAGRRPSRILLVDDNADAVDVLAEALRLDGHEVAVANDGPTALAIALAFRPEVALLDIGLPGLDGYDLARALRATGLPAPRLLALSGYGQDGDKARSREAGFEAHLVKPVDLEVVAELLAAEAAKKRS